MKKSNIIEIKGHPQENYYTCGCASFRTVLASLGLEDVSEQDLEILLNTSDKSGTHYNSMINIASKFNLDVKNGNNGTLELLDSLVNDGWVVVICFTIGGPHYSIYKRNNGNHLFIYNTDTNKEESYYIRKFVKNNWKVDINDFKVLIADWDLELDETYNSNKWWIAYKLNK